MAASNQNPITDDERRRIRDLHASGLSRNEIAKELGRAGSTVSKIAKELGLSFERGHEVEAATKARVADAKVRRAELMHELLDDAEKLRNQLFAPTIIHSFGGKDHTYNSKPVEQPLFKDQRDIMQSVSVAINASLRLDHHDTDGGAEGARGMVTALFGALSIAADALPPEDDGDTDDPDDD